MGLVSAPGRRLFCALTLAVLAVVGHGCSDAAPESPSRSAYPIYIEYQPADAGTIPAGTVDDAMCYHHSAPLNLVVSTSWGGQGRLELTSGSTYGLGLADVPGGLDVWLAFLDITLCPTGAIYVTRGVMVNGVAVTRVQTVDGHPALAFRIDSAGKIVP